MYAQNYEESAGARLLRLPVYSPDFNPIEQAISKVKSVLRKRAHRTVDGLVLGVGEALKSIRPSDALHYIALEDTRYDEMQAALRV